MGRPRCRPRREARTPCGDLKLGRKRAFVFRRLRIRYDRRPRGGREWPVPVDSSRDREAGVHRSWAARSCAAAIRWWRAARLWWRRWCDRFAAVASFPAAIRSLSARAAWVISLDGLVVSVFMEELCAKAGIAATIAAIAAAPKRCVIFMAYLSWRPRDWIILRRNYADPSEGSRSLQ